MSATAMRSRVQGSLASLSRQAREHGRTSPDGICIGIGFFLWIIPPSERRMAGTQGRRREEGEGR